MPTFADHLNILVICGLTLGDVGSLECLLEVLYIKGVESEN